MSHVLPARGLRLRQRPIPALIGALIGALLAALALTLFADRDPASGQGSGRVTAPRRPA